GAIITFAVILAVPLVYSNLGGGEYITQNINPDFFTVMGGHDWIWVMGVFFPTFLLLLGESNMYQKFFSAKSEKAARTAVMWWVVGTIVIETAIASLAILAFSHFNSLEVTDAFYLAAADSERIILHTARFGIEVGIPLVGGLLLICAAVAIITSTGNSFLLAPSTNLTRDIYQRFINPAVSEQKIVFFQRLMVLLLGIFAYLLLTQFRTILDMAFTAYTMVGAGLTPALLAAFLWKRVTTSGGVASIATGMGITLLITVLNSIAPSGDPLIPANYIILPAAGASIVVLILVSLLTAPDGKDKWGKFYEEKPVKLDEVIGNKNQENSINPD
nr:hypothetical protein [Saprospiraceae bacterium]